MFVHPSLFLKRAHPIEPKVPKLYFVFACVSLIFSSMSSLFVVSQSISVKRISFATKQLTGEGTWVLYASPGEVLDFKFPANALATEVRADGCVLERLSNEESAVNRFGRPVYVDRRGVAGWVPESLIKSEMLKDRRDLMSLILELKSQPRPEFSIYLPKSLKRGETSEKVKFEISINFELYGGNSFFNCKGWLDNDCVGFKGFFNDWYPHLLYQVLGHNKISVQLFDVPKSLRVVGTGNSTSTIDQAIFETAVRVRLDSIGLIIAPLVDRLESMGETLIVAPHKLSNTLDEFIHNFSKGLNEVLAIVGRELGGDVPSVQLVFVPGWYPRYSVFGDMVVLSADLLEKACDGHGLVFDVLEEISESIAAAAVAQLLNPIEGSWISEGLPKLVAGRVVESKLGVVEFRRRFLERRARFHAGVEAGQDWLPISFCTNTGISEWFRLKSGLVLDAIRIGLVGPGEWSSLMSRCLRKDISMSSEPVLNTDFLFTAAAEITGGNENCLMFRADWVDGIGAPCFGVGLNFLQGEKKGLIVQVVQRPLQPGYSSSSHSKVSKQGLKIDASRMGESRLSSSSRCPCDIDPQQKNDSSYDPPGAPSSRFRCWEGPMDLILFRAPNCPLPVSFEMRATPEPITSTISITQFTPRKQEIVRSRQPRPDELVHGWMGGSDDKWILAKTLYFQGILMWTNKLQFSRDLAEELNACSSLAHCRGSQWVLEVLADALRNPYYAWGTRAAAGKALVHLYCVGGEKEALRLLWGVYLGVEIGGTTSGIAQPGVQTGQSGVTSQTGPPGSVSTPQKSGLMKPAEVEIFVQVLRALAAGIESIRTSPHADMFSEISSRARLGVTSGRFDERIACEAAAAQVQVLGLANSRSTIESVLKSDLYGSPLRSRSWLGSQRVLQVVGLLGARQSNDSNGLIDIISCFIKLAIESEGANLPDSLLGAAMFALIGLLIGIGKARDVFNWLLSQSQSEIETPFLPLPRLHKDDAQKGIVILSGWRSLREQISRSSSLRKEFHNEFIVDSLWKIVQVVEGAILNEIFEIYFRLFGVKMPKCIEGRADLKHPEKETEKIFRKFVISGVFFDPEKKEESSAVNQPTIASKIVIGGMVRKLDETDPGPAPSTGGIRIGGIVFKST